MQKIMESLQKSNAETPLIKATKHNDLKRVA